MSDRLTPRQSADIRNAAARGRLAEAETRTELEQSADIRNAAARVRLAEAETRTELGLPAATAANLWDAVGEWAEIGTTVRMLAREHDFPRLEREIAAARAMVTKVGETVAEMRRHGELTERAKRHGGAA